MAEVFTTTSKKYVSRVMNDVSFYFKMVTWLLSLIGKKQSQVIHNFHSYWKGSRGQLLRPRLLAEFLLCLLQLLAIRLSR